jgi:hypothetical protein
MEELRATAKYIAQRGRGILASDESNATTGKRLDTIGVENTEDNRRWGALLVVVDTIVAAAGAGCWCRCCTLVIAPGQLPCFPAGACRSQGFAPLQVSCAEGTFYDATPALPHACYPAAESSQNLTLITCWHTPPTPAPRHMPKSPTHQLSPSSPPPRSWRELLYTAPGLGQYISGCIMFDETLYQSTADGTPFVKVLNDQGIVAGIKVDTGGELGHLGCQ